MFFVFAAAVLIVTGSVALLAVIGTRWMLAAAFAIHVAMTTVVMLTISHVMTAAPPFSHQVRTPATEGLRPAPPRRSAVADVALFFHLLGVLLFTVGIILAGAAFEYARRREQPAEIALLLGLTRIGVGLVVFGALLTSAADCGWCTSSTSATPPAVSPPRSSCILQR